MLKKKAIGLAARLRTRLAAARLDEKGQGTMEYAIIVVVAVVAAVALGAIISTLGQDAGAALTAQGQSVFQTS